ncbi:MAG: hypothetical protein M4D80_29710 [Myxococcota bacterium]|nr:hypothetical protein [Myxococcota bacterium]
MDVPVRGTIASFTLIDAVGTIELAGGERLRFGRSACKGFEPVVGARVMVLQIGTDARGRKAREVTLDPGDTSYDDLLAMRDAAHGLPTRDAPVEQMAAIARQLGVITVLMRDPIPLGTYPVRAWGEALGFPRDGFAVNAERDLHFAMGGHSVLTYPGREPFPGDGLDMRNVTADFNLGRSFIGLGIGVPGTARLERAVIRGDRDVWAPDGLLRQLSRLVCALAPHAIGVVLHRAGDLVVPIDDFVRMLGDLEDPTCVPFAAWLDVAITKREDQAMYATFGMNVFGLPDVLAHVNAEDRWSRARRHEAILYACYRMIRENRELEAGATFDVPVRLAIGAWPLELDEADGATTYTLADLDGNLELVLKAEPRTDAANVYQAQLDCGIAELVPSYLVRDVKSQSKEPVPHSVMVRARDDGRGFLTVTNGFGRTSQRELAIWTDHESFELVQIVGTFAAFAHESPEGWKPHDTIAAPIEERGIGGFVIADGGTVSTPHVQVLLLVPLSADNYERVRGGHAAAWLAANPPSEYSWAAFVAD